MTRPKDSETADGLLAYIRERQADEDGSGEWLPFALYQYTLALARSGDDAAADAIAQKLFEKMQARPIAKAEPLLINADEAARLLGITKAALWMRVSRHQIAGVVRTGRRTQFDKARLVAGLARRSQR